MKQNKKTRAWLLSFAALLVVLMSNTYVGRAEEEPFGNITKLWEIPFYKPFYDDGPFLIDISRKNVYVLRYYGGSDKNEHDTLHVFDLETGNIKKNIHFDINMGPYQFINNKSTMVVFSKDIKFFDCNSLELIKAEPYPNEMYYMTLFSEDGKTIVGCNNASVVQIYDYENNILLDTIPMERVEQYGYSTRPPGDIRISPDKKYILTVTSYEGYQQTIPAVTIFHVYDLSTKESIMRFVAKSPSQYVLSNDWKYLFVSELIDNNSHTNLHKINLNDSNDKIVFKLSLGLDKLYLTGNNKYFLFNLKNYYQKLDLRYGNFTQINNWPSVDTLGYLIQIIDDYLFTGKYPNLLCFKIIDSSLTNIFDKNFTEDTLYPNPTNNLISINNINTAGKTFKMTNITGYEIPILDKMQITDNSISIDMTSLISGTYYFNISDRTSSKTYIIKKI